MTWVVIAIVFLGLLGWSFAVAVGSTASRPLAVLGTVLDGLAMLTFGLGVFGGLLALVLGVLPETGLRLTGQSLRDVLIASGALAASGLVLVYAGSGVRKAAAKRPPGARAPARGGH